MSSAREGSSTLQFDLHILMEHETELVTIRNEFAIVKVGYSGDVPKALVITDINTGSNVTLDALDLEVLTRIDKEQLRGLIVQ